MDLFTEICKRGCIIEASSIYSVDHLPKCLAAKNNCIINPNSEDLVEFSIRSIIPGNYSAYCIKQYKQKKFNHMVAIYQKSGMIWKGNINFDFSDPSNNKNAILQLDLLTHYIYTNGNYGIALGGKPFIIYKNNKYPDMSLCKNSIRSKMIQNLINQNILYYFHALEYIFPIPEIKLVIIDMFIKSENWNTLGLSINYWSG
jgi:hypothetical protein